MEPCRDSETVRDYYVVVVVVVVVVILVVSMVDNDNDNDNERSHICRAALAEPAPSSGNLNPQ